MSRDAAIVGQVRCSGPGGGVPCPIGAGPWIHHTSERCATCVCLRAGEERLHGQDVEPQSITTKGTR